MRSSYKRIGKYVKQVNVRNRDLSVTNLQGISINKMFMPSVANTHGTDLSKYKIVSRKQFAFNPMHVGRDKVLPISMLEEEESVIVSPAYVVLEVKDENELLPDYLMMWCRRSEFDRNAWFTTDSSVRGGFSWKDFCEMELPVPHTERQREIVKEYQTIVNRIKLNEQLNQKLEETAQAIYKQWFVDFEFPISAEYAAAIGKPVLEGKPYKSSGGAMVYNEKLDQEIPKGWKSGQLGSLVEVVNGYAFKSEEFCDAGNIPVVKIKNIQPPSVSLDECHYFEGEINEKLKKYVTEPGDILISMTGSHMNQMGSAVGKIGRYNRKRVSLLNQRVGKLKPIHGNTCSEYVYHFISRKETHYELLLGATGSANQANISPDQIRSLTIVIPATLYLEFFEKLASALNRKIILNDYANNFNFAFRDLILLKNILGKAA